MKITKKQLKGLTLFEKEELYKILTEGTKITAGKAQNKGWVDTPLFLSAEEQKQMKLF
ncbi:hypothetical protein [Flectobacillus roseus]|uniref:hypothetical protein n=1 Tax=Flectobacillus roseus TaxID=502259 RepID=UPI0024B838DC|nr:hypothetical protein [Flectobacillus roseus]MDI9871329.1 hypothetical protein [Flectobacillus roseus]